MNTRIKISVVSSAISDDPREAALRSRTFGFDGLLFDAITPVIDLTALSISGRREFAHVMRASAQTITAIRADIGTKGLSVGADIDRALAICDKAANLARDLQSRCIAVDLIAVSESGDVAMTALGAIADRYEVFFAFSNSLGTFAAIDRALHIARCPWFGVDLDSVAALREAWKPTSILHVRARDAIAGEGNRVKPVEIGKGSVNWLELFATLDSAGYHGPITIDPVEIADRIGAALRGLKFLRALS